MQPRLGLVTLDFAHRGTPDVMPGDRAPPASSPPVTRPEPWEGVDLQAALDNSDQLARDKAARYPGLRERSLSFKETAAVVRAAVALVVALACAAIALFR